MNPTVAAAQQAIQGLSPSQAPAAPTVDTSMPAGFNANGTMAPVSSAAPTQLSSVTPELNAMFNAQQGAVPAQLQLGTNAANAATQVSNNYYNFQAQRQKAIQDAQDKMAANDPKNFVQSRAQDGGYNFTDPTGKPITARQYAQVQGKDVQDVLKGSNNPTDVQYMQDHTNMESIMSAMQSGDSKSLDKAATSAGFKNGADLTSSLGKAGITTPQQLVQSFMGAYPNIWGNLNQAQGTSVGNQRTPTPGMPNAYWGGGGNQ